ncbi:CheY-like superfamily [Halteromyces radiatus]|uniref:CheY-like superfamily n=1 Tax=Halteromyces radiatus TaxID=101107 RepID=UPI00222026B6|nr:CheY-like superfamily [Halteromyces radiatus]KAI8086497.1 CheY-like superfamily [Halteromyces radiatus]
MDVSIASPTIKKETSALKILLVDDNPINLKLLRRKLSTLFKIHHMDLAYDGHQALQLLEQKLYDVILLDIDMPRLNGIETTRSIRQPIKSSSSPHILESNRTIPIIAVTTNDSYEERQLYQEVGMDACLGKPVNTSQLKFQLLQLLDDSLSSSVII